MCTSCIHIYVRVSTLYMYTQVVYYRTIALPRMRRTHNTGMMRRVRMLGVVRHARTHTGTYVYDVRCTMYHVRVVSLLCTTNSVYMYIVPRTRYLVLYVVPCT